MSGKPWLITRTPAGRPRVEFEGFLAATDYVIPGESYPTQAEAQARAVEIAAEDARRERETQLGLFGGEEVEP